MVNLSAFLMHELVGAENVKVLAPLGLRADEMRLGGA